MSASLKMKLGEPLAAGDTWPGNLAELRKDPPPQAPMGLVWAYDGPERMAYLVEKDRPMRDREIVPLSLAMADQNAP